jgi:hypothetical protein
MAAYEVTYEGRIRPADRDGVEVRARLWRDGDYFQFITCEIAGVDLISAPRDVLSDKRLWPIVALELATGGEAAVRTGVLPLADPTSGYRVPVNLAGAWQKLQSSASLPTLAEGEQIHQFDA